MGTTPWAGDVRSDSNYPATHISWNDAQEFIRRLNEWSGSNVYRLPSEAEWEYACRAGTSTRWSHGDDVSQLKHYAWFGGVVEGWMGVQLVGTKRANPWGLYDMHGKVWEWVQDCFNDSYSGAPNDGSAWERGDCSKRVLRGSSWSGRSVNQLSVLRCRSTTGVRDDRQWFSSCPAFLGLASLPLYLFCFCGGKGVDFVEKSCVAVSIFSEYAR